MVGLYRKAKADFGSGEGVFTAFWVVVCDRGWGGVIVGNVYRVGWNIDLLLFYIRLVILFFFVGFKKCIYLYRDQ